MIGRSTVWLLGVSQLVCWGISYYLIGVLGEPIARDLGWSSATVYGGFSLALLVMGLSSPWVGRVMDRHGGRVVMSAGSLLLALGFGLLAMSHDEIIYYAAWICLGLAMRCTLYDAAFAALARIGGSGARRPISQITLLGGLASTAFWPIGGALAAGLGWRGAVWVYAVVALATLPLHLAIPRGRHVAVAKLPEAGGAERPPVRDPMAAPLYALIVMVTSFLNSAMSAHMIGLLASMGMALATAVWISSLRGIGQSSARLCEVLFGGRLHPVALNLLAASVMPISIIAGFWSGQWLFAALVFSMLYGAGNGILTITRGTLPLVLFDTGTYGTVVGRLLAPSFLLSAAAPLLYAWVIEGLGADAAMLLSLVAASICLVASLVLRQRQALLR